MYGDAELIRLNYVLFPNRDIGPHTRVDIANEAVDEIRRLRNLVEALELAHGHGPMKCGKPVMETMTTSGGEGEGL